MSTEEANLSGITYVIRLLLDETLERLERAPKEQVSILLLAKLSGKRTEAL
jgi:hypothetical protein